MKCKQDFNQRYEDEVLYLDLAGHVVLAPTSSWQIRQQMIWHMRMPQMCCMVGLCLPQVMHINTGQVVIKHMPHVLCHVIKCVVSHMGVTVPDYNMQNSGAPTCVTSNYKMEHILAVNGYSVFCGLQGLHNGSLFDWRQVTTCDECHNTAKPKCMGHFL